MMLPEPPCSKCTSLCCKQSHPDINWPHWAVDLMPDEHYPEAVPAQVAGSESTMALPYIDGRCVYLLPPDADGRELCGIYDNRPKLCREFNCLSSYNCKHDSNNRPIHGHFLEDQPVLVQLIESEYPTFRRGYDSGVQ